MSIWSSRILSSVTQSQSLKISSSITNVKVKRGKAIPNAKKNGVEFEKKYSERAILFPQMIVDTIFNNKRKPLVQGHITCK